MLSATVDDAEREASDELAALFARLRLLDLAACSVPELRRAASGLRAVRSWVEAASARVLVALADTKDGALSVAEVLDDEGVSGRERRHRRAVARGVGLAPLFGDALEAGWVSSDHVAALSRVRNRDAVPDAAAGLLVQARGVAPEEFVRRLAAWDDELDADNGASADAVRHKKRGVTFSVRADGMGVTNVVLPPAEHATLKDAVLQFAEELWRNSGDKESTPTQRQADAVLEIVTRATGAPSPFAGKRPAAADIEPAAASPSTPSRTGDRDTQGTRPVHERPEPPPPPNRPSNLRSTLLVIVNELDLRSGVGPSSSPGSGRTADGMPLSTAEVRRLACTAGIIPVVMNGAGRVLDVGRQQRLCTDAQWWALVARDQGCVFAGCDASVHHTEAHHCLPWEHGGRTDLANLCLVCKRHHRLIHERDWTMEVLEGKVHCLDDAGGTVPTNDPGRPNLWNSG